MTCVGSPLSGRGNEGVHTSVARRGHVSPTGESAVLFLALMSRGDYICYFAYKQCHLSKKTPHREVSRSSKSCTQWQSFMWVNLAYDHSFVLASLYDNLEANSLYYI